MRCRPAQPGIPAALAAIALLLAGADTATPADKRNVTVERLAYQGWKNNLKLSNGQAELIITLDVGPRILSYKLAGGVNVFKEFADHLGKSGEAEWMCRGGHRLWASPEDLTRTYYGDNGPVKAVELSDGFVRLTPEPETPYGLQKEIDVKLDPTGTGVTVVHRIKNVGHEPTELAPWGLTVMDGGGVEIIPLPPKSPHPGSPKNAKTPEDFAPNQSFIFWPYTDFTDPRFTFGSRYLLLRQEPGTQATKIGMAHAGGWVGYLNHGALFVKKFPRVAGKTYPDRGCNFETYTDANILEIESLGPLVKLEPKHQTEHTEHWELHAVSGAVKTEKDVETLILPKLGHE